MQGEPGEIAVFARRAGTSWFVAGINGTGKVRPVNVDLSPFEQFDKRIAVTEGRDAKMQASAVPLGKSRNWKHGIPPRGGFILRLDR